MGMAVAEALRYVQPQTHELLRPAGKDAIVKTLGYLGLHFSDYFVIGGANLVLRDIKEETTDIDILAKETVINALSKKRGAEIHDPPIRAQEKGADNTTIWLKNSRTKLPVSVTTSLGDGFYPMSFESHQRRTEIVEGVPCLLLDDVVAAKEAIQRPKDLFDLQAIAHFLEEPLDLPRPTILNPVPFS